MLCPQCHGSGWMPSIDAHGPQPCETCRGIGWLHGDEGMPDMTPPILDQIEEWYRVLGGEG